MMLRSRAGVIVLTGVMLIFSCLANASVSERRVYGWVEKVNIPAMGVTTKAKMDSGALTSSIHADNVERFSRDGKKWVRFDVTLKDTDTDEEVTKTLERPFVRRIKLYGAGGTDRRLVVLMDICVGDQLLQEQFSLSDRADKIYGLLIGRRTMEHIGLLDVTQTFTAQPNCQTN